MALTLSPDAAERLEGLLTAVDLDARVLAATLAVPAWLVGGVVRDALLGRATRDVDVVVEGDAPAAARRLAAALAGSVVVHPPFSTAAVRHAGGLVDVATARTESYPRPGALPVVRPARLAADLARRDFAANALAVALGPTGLGRLVDPLGGLDDIRRGRLRVLHAGSFRDDATRILRGVRYEARLGFRLDEEADRLARAAVRGGLLGSVGADRLWGELLLVLAEPAADAALARLADLGVLGAVLPGVPRPAAGVLSRETVEAAVRRHAPEADVVALRLGLVLRGGKPATRTALLAEAPLPRGLRQTALAVAGVDELAATLARDEDPAAVAGLLERLPVEAALAVVVAGGEPAAARARRWLDELRHVRLAVDGAVLQAELGLRPSPALGAVLAELRRRKLRGELPDRAAELAAARALAARAEDGG